MVDTVSALSRVGPATPVQTPAVPPAFGVGQQHVGAVLRVLPQGGVLAELNGQPLILEPGVALQPGDTFVATVTQTAPTLVLQLTRHASPGAASQAVLTALPLPTASPAAQAVTGSPLTPAQLKSYLEASQPLGQSLIALAQLLAQQPLLQELDAPLLQALRETLAVLQPRREEPPDAAQLQEQVDRAGLNYEKKVERAVQGEPGAMAALAKDLKGQLLALAQRLEQVSHDPQAPQAREATALLPQVTRTLENLEFQQVVQQFAPAEQQPIVLSLAQPFSALTQPMSLAVQRDGQAGTATTEAPERYTLVLQLDLTGLGPLQIAATVQGPDLTTAFQVHDAAIAALVHEASPELVAQLQALGFHTQVSCAVQPHLAPDPGLQVPRVLAQATHLVDMTI